MRDDDLWALATEAIDPRYANLDLMSVEELATAMIDQYVWATIAWATACAPSPSIR